MAPGLNNLEIIPFRVAAYDMKVGTFILESLRFIFLKQITTNTPVLRKCHIIVCWDWSVGLSTRLNSTIPQWLQIR